MEKLIQIIKNIIGWAITAFFLVLSLAAFVSGGVISGILFVIGAVILNPLFTNCMRSKGINFKKIISIPVLVVSFFGGILAFPATNTSAEIDEPEIVEEVAIEDNENIAIQITPTPKVKDEIEIEKETDDIEEKVIVSPTPMNKKEKVESKDNDAKTNEEKSSSVNSSTTKTAEANAPTPDTSVPAVNVPTPEITETVVPETPVQTVDTASENSTTDTNSAQGGGSNFDTYNNAEQQNTTETWVLNTSSNKIHHPSCKSVKKIAPQNYSTSSESLDVLLSKGYDTCGNCF